MTAAEAAARIRHTGTADGHVMVMWTDPETDSRSFFRQPKRPPPEPETPNPPRGPPQLARALAPQRPTAAIDETNDTAKRKCAEAPEGGTRRGTKDTVATRTRGNKRRATQRDDGDNGCWVTIPAWTPDAMDFDWSHTFQHGPTATVTLSTLTTADVAPETPAEQASAAEHTGDGAATGATQPTQQSEKRGRSAAGIQDGGGRSPKKRAVGGELDRPEQDGGTMRHSTVRQTERGNNEAAQAGRRGRPPTTRVGETEGELELPERRGGATRQVTKRKARSEDNTEAWAGQQGGTGKPPPKRRRSGEGERCDVHREGQGRAGRGKKRYGEDNANQQRPAKTQNREGSTGEGEQGGQHTHGHSETSTQQSSTHTRWGLGFRETQSPGREVQGSRARQNNEHGREGKPKKGEG